MTHIASEKIALTCPPADGRKSGSLFILDPTTGTLVVKAEHRDKVARSLDRAARRLKFFLYVELLRLNILKFTLQCWGAAVKLFCKIMGVFS